MIYGAEHLLRMLGTPTKMLTLNFLMVGFAFSVNLPQMVAQANLDIESVIIIRDYTNELMLYVAFFCSSLSD